MFKSGHFDARPSIRLSVPTKILRKSHENLAKILRNKFFSPATHFFELNPQPQIDVDVAVSILYPSIPFSKDKRPMPTFGNFLLNIIIPTYDPSSKNWKSVLAQFNPTKLQSFFNPFAKERRDLNFRRNGVILQGPFDSNAQSAPAFPKRGNHSRNFGSKTSKFIETFYKQIFVDVEKWNVGNRLKRVLAKFRADVSHVAG